MRSVEENRYDERAENGKRLGPVLLKYKKNLIKASERDEHAEQEQNDAAFERQGDQQAVGIIYIEATHGVGCELCPPAISKLANRLSLVGIEKAGGNTDRALVVSLVINNAAFFRFRLFFDQGIILVHALLERFRTARLSAVFLHVGEILLLGLIRLRISDLFGRAVSGRLFRAEKIGFGSRFAFAAR